MISDFGIKKRGNATFFLCFAYNGQGLTPPACIIVFVLRYAIETSTGCFFTPVGGSVCHKSVGLAYHRQGREPLQNGISQAGV